MRAGVDIGWQSSPSFFMSEYPVMGFLLITQRRNGITIFFIAEAGGIFPPVGGREGKCFFIAGGIEACSFSNEGMDISIFGYI